MKAIHFLLKNQLKSTKLLHRNGGFTLIELIVALVIAFIIITPVLGFMISVMRTDQQEQAKATSEQELQTAIDYINQDLQQAVYVYNSSALTNNSPNGIKNQLPTCPSGQTCTPVLVFWKRLFLDRSATIKNASNGNTTVGSLIATVQDQPGDTFVYSLVGYYLVEGGNNNSWSPVARISRFEIRDGIRGSTGNYIGLPSSGFAPFNLSLSGDLENKMKQWTKDSSTPYDANVLDVLVDYISDTNNTNVPALIDPASCTGGLTGKEKIFTACVDSKTGFAQVAIRGNALARVKISTSHDYQKAYDNFFPVVSTQVKGRGFLFVK